MTNTDDLMSIEKVRAKALHLNLDPSRYGTICEIGAGQRVAGQFFKVGAAAGTIAKTMSAYDMTVSDEIYGKAPRYVCRERVEQMLTTEYDSLVSRLHEQRGAETTFFAYAATVAAKRYKVDNYCHGHIGIRFQHKANAEASNIHLHVHMLEDNAEQQAQALGMLGVNLIFGAFYSWDNPKQIIDKLLDELSSERVEVDFIEFSGPAFPGIENRLMNLQLIRSWCTRAVFFDENGQSQVPGNRLRKTPVMTIRGSYRPPTKVINDMFKSGKAAFTQLRQLDEEQILTVAELTMSELGQASALSDQDFLNRVDLLSALGHCVIVSDYYRFFRLRSWLRNHTHEPFAITLSVRDIPNLLNPEFYSGLEGGLLEGMGKLFPGDTHVFVYPALLNDTYTELGDLALPGKQQSLLLHLSNNSLLAPCAVVDRDNLKLYSKRVSQMLIEQNDAWQDAVDPRLVPLIKDQQMFMQSEN